MWNRLPGQSSDTVIDLQGRLSLWTCGAPFSSKTWSCRELVCLSGYSRRRCCRSVEPSIDKDQTLGWKTWGRQGGDIDCRTDLGPFPREVSGNRNKSACASWPAGYRKREHPNLSTESCSTADALIWVALTRGDSDVHVFTMVKHPVSMAVFVDMCGALEPFGACAQA